MFYNSDYLCFMVPAFLLVMIAQLYVNSAYSKWGKIGVRSGLTGTQAAERLISNGGLTGVRVERIAGKLTDHYDPRTHSVSLSDGVANQPSVAARLSRRGAP